MKRFKIPDNEWWRMNARKNEISVIEWTPKENGYVRTKLDSISSWSYAPCSLAQYAESLGKMLILTEKRNRTKKLAEYENDKYEIFYDGFQEA